MLLRNLGQTYNWVGRDQQAVDLGRIGGRSYKLRLEKTVAQGAISRTAVLVGKGERLWVCLVHHFIGAEDGGGHTGGEIASLRDREEGHEGNKENDGTARHAACQLDRS